MSPDALDQLTIALDPGSRGLLVCAIIMLMFAIALGLRKDHFSFLLSDPKLAIGGAAAQVIALPIVTLALIFLIKPAPSIALGMIVVAACPGGAVSNFMSWAARADLAYSVTLTAISSILATFWTPTAILLWTDLYPPTATLLDSLEFDRLSFVLQTTILLAVPLTAGMVFAVYKPDIATKIRRPIGLLGGFIMGAVIIYGAIDFLPILIGAWKLILVPVALHNALAFVTGAVIALYLARRTDRRRTLIIEVGIQNSGLALILLVSQLQGLGGAAAIAAVWGVWHLIAGAAIVSLFRTLDHRKALR